ncbi:type 1 glutamine amidotransferase domain-containing protein [Algoriphagus sp. A40]|uniref:type 1 glutamine amidotransferase domain-containing protein n=1 Tax=Algoriphagus sp. A40 TaxID=1945863 RepID=UPI00098555DF|nr:type 1 glutamine amidotransferase domain-containing protein [Algoriphagus sp. A40]OOG77660.1 type 1 glutamine amidotransferase domain-containing protein [Algoriphagus sp. A40]
MSKAKKLLKWSLIAVTVSLILLAGFGWWFMGLLPPSNPSAENIKAVLPSSLVYLNEKPSPTRGKILAVVTSTDSIGSSGKRTGYELTELAQGYSVFVANGFEVDIASPKGGEPPLVLDEEDMGVYDYAFLNDPIAQSKLKETILMDQVRIEDYEAIYLVGGKGAMFDFPDHPSMQLSIRALHERGKVIGAVCHGPAALVNVKLADGTPFLKDRKVCSFTNKEELFLIQDARELFPFLLQDKLAESGASFSEGPMYLENVVIDGTLVTGQNPWSTWTTAEAMVRQLGFEPKKREKSAAENTVSILNAYEKDGYAKAKLLIEGMNQGEKQEIDRNLMAMHALVAAMQWEISRGVELIGLLRYAASFVEKSQ